MTSSHTLRKSGALLALLAAAHLAPAQAGLWARLKSKFVGPRAPVSAETPPPVEDAYPAPAPIEGPQDLHDTEIRFLPENTDAWYARWYMLSQAQESIDITYFNFYKDPFGMALLGLVREKARAGVQVRLMVDSRGSLRMATRWLAQGYLRELVRYPNVQVRVYKPLGAMIKKFPRQLRKVIASNHDKIMIVDGEWVVTGGRNLGQHYFTHPEDDPESYRDNDVLMHGAAIATEVEAAFTREFDHLDNFEISLLDPGDASGVARNVELAYQAMEAWMGGEDLPDPTDLPRKTRRMAKKLYKKLRRFANLDGYADFAADPLAGGGTYPARLLDKSSYGRGSNDITSNLMQALDEAQESILIQNAYLVLTDELEAAFQRASARGVKITILTNSPASTDNVLTQAFFLKDWKRWLAEIPGLEIYMAEEHKIHAKTFVFDDDRAMISSYNLDPMSESINSEVAVMVEDGEFAGVVRERLEEDLEAMVRCEIRVGEDGEVEGVLGPDDYLAGFKGIVIRLISKIGWLRPLV